MPLNDDTWFMEDELHDIEPPPFLIEDTLPVRSVNMLFGEFNLGKTFLAIDWAASVATGRSWVGKQVEQGEVLYVASEGDPGNLGTRTASWREHFEDIPLPILFYTDIVDLETSAGELLQEAVARGLRPRLIIIDTLAMAMDEGENDNDKMNALVRKLRRQQEYADPETGEMIEVAWLLVHHVGWSDKGRPRGGSGMPAGLDYIIGMKDGPADTIEVFSYKAKNSAKFLPLLFRQEPVGESLVYQHVPLSEAAELKRSDTESFPAEVEALLAHWLEKVWPPGTTFGQVTFMQANDLDKKDSATTKAVSRAFEKAVTAEQIERKNTRTWVVPLEEDEDVL